MSKTVLLSINPEWCAQILNGEKTLEIRKNYPKVNEPFKVYLYCTKKGRPLVYGDVFRGNWEMEYCTTYGWSRDDADLMWGILNGKVVGEFTCDYVKCYTARGIYQTKIEVNGAYVPERLRWNAGACLDSEAMYNYSKGKDLYGWHISDLQIYEEPKELSDLGLTKAPQSWCYIKEN